MHVAFRSSCSSSFAQKRPPVIICRPVVGIFAALPHSRGAASFNPQIPFSVGATPTRPAVSVSLGQRAISSAKQHTKTDAPGQKSLLEELGEVNLDTAEYDEDDTPSWNPDTQPVEELFESGQATSEDLEKAFVVIEEAILREPEAFRHRLNKARLHMELDEPHLAAPLFDEAARYAHTAAEQARIKFWRGILDDAQGNHLAAVELFSESLRLDPDVLTVFNRGCALLNAGKPKEALQDLDKALASDPKNPFFHYQRGVALASVGRLPDAIAAFQRTIALDKTNMEAFYNLGVCKRKQGRHAEAIDIFTYAIDFGEKWIRQYDEDEELDADLVQDMHDLYFERGRAFLALDRFTDALNDFDRGVKFNGTEKMKAARGECLFAMDRWDEAEAAFSDALLHSPNSADLYTARAGCRFSLLRLPEALEDYSKALELDNRHAAAYHDRGRLYQVAKNIPKALEDYNKALQWDPERGMHWASRGSALLLADPPRYRDALTDLEKAVELEPRLRRMLLANMNMARQKLNMPPIQPTREEAEFLAHMAAQEQAQEQAEEAAQAAKQRKASAPAAPAAPPRSQPSNTVPVRPARPRPKQPQSGPQAAIPADPSTPRLRSVVKRK